MTQITLQACTSIGSPIGTPIPLEVASFDQSRKAKLRTYSRVQAFSDTTLVVGAYNREFTLAVAVPQVGGEDIETLLAGMQGQDQLLTDAEGYMRQVRITGVGTKHLGGQPQYYEVDVSMIAINNTEISPTPPIVDVVRIGASDDIQALHDGFQRKSFYANGRWWVFWSDGAGNLVYSTSLNRLTWTSPIPIAGAFVSTGYDITVWFDGVHFAVTSVGPNIFFSQGTPNPLTGTITWEVPFAPFQNTGVSSHAPTLTMDSTGHYWTTSNTAFFNANENAHTDGTWSPGIATTVVTPAGDFRLSAVPLVVGEAIVYGYTGNKVNVEFWNGAVWSTPPTPTTNTMPNASSLTAVSIGDMVHIAFLGDAPTYNVIYARFNTATNLFEEETILVATGLQYARPSISKDSFGRIYIFYPNSVTSSIKYLIRSASGTWSSLQSFTPVVGAFPADNRIASTWDDTGGYINVLFLAASGGSPAWNVWIGFFQTY